MHDSYDVLSLPCLKMTVDTSELWKINSFQILCVCCETDTWCTHSLSLYGLFKVSLNDIWRSFWRFYLNVSNVTDADNDDDCDRNSYAVFVSSKSLKLRKELKVRFLS